MLRLQLAGDIPLLPVSLFNVILLAREVFVVSAHAALLLAVCGRLPVIGTTAS